MPSGAGQTAIDELVHDFFASFTNTGGRAADVRRVYQLAIPSAVIVKATHSAPEIYSLREFVEPRHEILTNGTLVDFEETEESARTTIAGNVAQRYSHYRKAGVLAGQPFAGRGAKVFQFVRLPDGWRLSALAWDDERDGFALPDAVGM